MTATSQSTGHIIKYDKKLKCWVYKDNKGNVSGNRPCKHCSKPPIAVKVKIASDLSVTGKTKWKYALIDACIAPIIKALQKGNIDMRGSCCGHGSNIGDIHLQDNRYLIIKKTRDYAHLPCVEASCGIAIKFGVPSLFP